MLKFAIVPVTPYEQNCSVLLCEDTGKIAVIDPGGDLPLLREQIMHLGGTVELVLLTHGHMDHASQARVFADELHVPLVGPHVEDKFWLDLLPDSCARTGFPHVEPFVPDHWLVQDETVMVGNQTLEVIHCPGHTPGHVVFYHRAQNIAWVGDVLFEGSIGRTDFPRGDYATLIDSITRKLFPLGRDVTFVHGHGPLSTFGHEMDNNPFVAGKYR